MSKFCKNCGSEIINGNKFCNNCGAPVEESDSTTVNVEVNVNAGSAPVIAKRNIALAIVLSIITCGIYGIYWFVVMTNEAAEVSGDNSTASGGLAVVYTIITCGIYSIYWNYKMGQKMYTAGKKYNKDIQDNSVLYLVLSIFGLSIVNYCLIQNDLNRFANE